MNLYRNNFLSSISEIMCTLRKCFHIYFRFLDANFKGNILQNTHSLLTVYYLYDPAQPLSAGLSMWIIAKCNPVGVKMLLYKHKQSFIGLKVLYILRPSMRHLILIHDQSVSLQSKTASCSPIKLLSIFLCLAHFLLKQNEVTIDIAL